MKFFNKIQYISLFLLSFVLIGITSVITGGIGNNPLKDISFYVDNGLTYTAIILVSIGILLLIIDAFETSNKEYNICISEIAEFASSPLYIPTIFMRFCDYINRLRKIKQYSFDIKAKLFKLEHKAKEKDMLIWNKGTEEEKASNKYCRKRLLLEEQLIEGWIEKNINIIYVKYDKITSDVILGGFYSKKANMSPNDFITKNKMGKFAKDKIALILFSFALTCLVSSVALDFQLNLQALIKFLTKVLVLLWNAIRTINYSKRWTKEITLKDARWRNGIVREYRKWLKQTGGDSDVKDRGTSESSN